MIPQLGFNHEDSGQSFVLDLADLHRDKLTIPAAFRAVPIEGFVIVTTRGLRMAWHAEGQSVSR